MRKEKGILYFGLGAVFVVIALGIFAIVDSRESDQTYRELFGKNYRIFTPELPTTATFANEKAPLDRPYVKEAFEREILINTYMHASTIMMFKRANRWFPVIEPILKRNNIPDDFKFLALAESNLINSVSPSGAEGFWQFMKPTGIRYGLEINEEVDERYNIAKATQAACDYFLESKEKLNNWTMVAASYNRGVTGVLKAMNNQRVTNYYDLYLVDETSRYVYRILAMKEIYNHPTKYGYFLREEEFYQPLEVDTIVVDSTVTDLPAFAFEHNTSYRVLRDLNPWLQGYQLPNKTRKSYSILLPKNNNFGIKGADPSKKNDHFFHDTIKINAIR